MYLNEILVFVNAFHLCVDFADLVLLKCLVCSKQFLLVGQHGASAAGSAQHRRALGMVVLAL